MSEEGDDRPAYSFRVPRSALLEPNITRGRAKQLAAQGFYPPRCIWIPGPYRDGAEYGDLFGPDENWQPARPILAKEDARTEAARRAEAERRDRYGPSPAAF